MPERKKEHIFVERGGEGHQQAGDDARQGERKVTRRMSSSRSRQDPSRPLQLALEAFEAENQHQHGERHADRTWRPPRTERELDVEDPAHDHQQRHAEDDAGDQSGSMMVPTTVLARQAVARHRHRGQEAEEGADHARPGANHKAVLHG